MLIEPTFLEALLAQRPDVEKRIKKGYKISKKNIKDRLKICDNDKGRIKILEDTLNEIEFDWNISKLGFMVEVLDTVFVRVPYNYSATSKQENYTSSILESDGDDSFPLGLRENILDLRLGFFDKEFKVKFPNYAQKVYELTKRHGFKKANRFYAIVAQTKYYRLYLSFLKERLAIYRVKVAETISTNEDDFIVLNKVQKKTKDGKTVLGTNQTALLSLYLRDAHAILTQQDGLSNLTRTFHLIV
jgi:hypothetical protein